MERMARFMALTTMSNLSGRHLLDQWGDSIKLAATLLVGYVAYAAP